VHKEAATATKTAVQDVQGQALIEPEMARETIAALESRRVLLDWLLVGVGLTLSLGLFAYGIKMTHKVAGPLHKVALYCDKVAAGTFDTVHNLRRGDQLVEFYAHFKQAHGVLRRRQERDVATLRAVIDAAEQHELAGRTEELAARLEDLRTLLRAKEVTLG
jgi:nitrogen fixation/metabolism regulation signal transduction histidine kinase